MPLNNETIEAQYLRIINDLGIPQEKLDKLQNLTLERKIHLIIEMKSDYEKEQILIDYIKHLEDVCYDNYNNDLKNNHAFINTNLINTNLINTKLINHHNFINTDLINDANFINANSINNNSINANSINNNSINNNFLNDHKFFKNNNISINNTTDIHCVITGIMKILPLGYQIFREKGIKSIIKYLSDKRELKAIIPLVNFILQNEDYGRNVCEISRLIFLYVDELFMIQNDNYKEDNNIKDNDFNNNIKDNDFNNIKDKDINNIKDIDIKNDINKDNDIKNDINKDNDNSNNNFVSKNLTSNENQKQLFELLKTINNRFPSILLDNLKPSPNDCILNSKINLLINHILNLKEIKNELSFLNADLLKDLQIKFLLISSNFYEIVKNKKVSEEGKSVIDIFLNEEFFCKDEQNSISHGLKNILKNYNQKNEVVKNDNYKNNDFKDGFKNDDLKNDDSKDNNFKNFNIKIGIVENKVLKDDPKNDDFKLFKKDAEDNFNDKIDTTCNEIHKKLFPKNDDLESYTSLKSKEVKSNDKNINESKDSKDVKNNNDEKDVNDDKNVDENDKDVNDYININDNTNYNYDLNDVKNIDYIKNDVKNINDDANFNDNLNDAKNNNNDEISNFLNLLKNEKIQFQIILENLMNCPCLTKIFFEKIKNQILEISTFVNEKLKIEKLELEGQKKNLLLEIEILKNEKNEILKRANKKENDDKLIDDYKVNNEKINESTINEIKVNNSNVNEIKVNDEKMKESTINDSKSNENKVNQNKVNDEKIKESTINDSKSNENKSNEYEVNENKSNADKSTNQNKVKAMPKKVKKMPFKKKSSITLYNEDFLNVKWKRLDKKYGVWKNIEWEKCQSMFSIDDFLPFVKKSKPVFIPIESKIDIKTIFPPKKGNGIAIALGRLKMKDIDFIKSIIVNQNDSFNDQNDPFNYQNDSINYQNYSINNQNDSINDNFNSSDITTNKINSNSIIENKIDQKSIKNILLTRTIPCINENIIDQLIKNFPNDEEINKLRELKEIVENKNDENKSGKNKSVENKNDENKSGKNKSDENKNDENKSDENKNDENKSGKNKSDENKNDENKSGKNKSDENKNDENKSGKN
ncbi:hypothetical protein DMUE_4374, partial [Dictyocoela muelleri]